MFYGSGMKFRLVFVYYWFRYDIPRIIGNLIFFFPAICRYRSWDYAHCVDVFRTSLIPLQRSMQNGYHTCSKDNAKQLQNIIDRLKVFESSDWDDNLGDDEWNDIWDTLKLNLRCWWE